MNENRSSTELTLKDWIVLLVLLAGLVALFARPGSAFVVRIWQSYRCVPTVQADLNELQSTSVADPIVEKCIGPNGSSVCFVTILSKGTRKTGPLEPWDCTVRHAPDGTRRFLEPDTSDADRRKIADRLRVDPVDLAEGANYVFERFQRLQASFDGN